MFLVLSVNTFGPSCTFLWLFKAIFSVETNNVLHGWNWNA
jgi:hypothetical protein